MGENVDQNMMAALMSSGSMVQVGSEEEENIIAKYRLMHFAVFCYVAFSELRSLTRSMGDKGWSDKG